jgi:hypothetical protein
MYDDTPRAIARLERALRQHAEALEQIRKTLRLLVTHLTPEVMEEAEGGAQAPLSTSPLVIVDPERAGYTLTQRALAEALGQTPTDVSVLVRAFGIREDPELSVAVRRSGSKRAIYNYHPRAIGRFHEQVEEPPESMDPSQRSALRRVRERRREGRIEEP